MKGFTLINFFIILVIGLTKSKNYTARSLEPDRQSSAHMPSLEVQWPFSFASVGINDFHFQNLQFWWPHVGSLVG
jgi:hypothetical protein